MRPVSARPSIPTRSSAIASSARLRKPLSPQGRGQGEGWLAGGGPMDVRDEILNRIDERQDEWLGLLGDLVRRPSENPPGDTRAAAECLVEYLEGKGHAHEIVEPTPGMVNV